MLPPPSFSTDSNWIYILSKAMITLPVTQLIPHLPKQTFLYDFPIIASSLKTPSAPFQLLILFPSHLHNPPLISFLPWICFKQNVTYLVPPSILTHWVSPALCILLFFSSPGFFRLLTSIPNLCVTCTNPSPLCKINKSIRLSGITILVEQNYVQVSGSLILLHSNILIVYQCFQWLINIVSLLKYCWLY